MNLIAPKVGDHCVYRSPFRTGDFDAIIMRVNDDGTVAVRVLLPVIGVRREDDMSASIELRAVSFGRDGRCYLANL